MSAYIKNVEKGSIADKYGITKGSTLLKINDHDITDVLDYRFYMVDTSLKVTYKGPDNKFYIIKVLKDDEYEDLGLEFDTYLIDNQHSCRNKCVFCFIDQLPKGMRKSLYFKDDDSRLSFFYGNYITLTNLKQSDIDRIIKMHISPVNVSVHTMNKELRTKMMNNKNAGESLKYLKQLSDAGITVNTQLVLCPGINDGDELLYSLTELSKLYPGVASVACVPVGLTDYREGLCNLTMYTKTTATDTISIINQFGDSFKAKNGTRFCYAADEFYLKAKMPIPDEDYYEDYPQLDNGVGLIRLFESEVDEAVKTQTIDTNNNSDKLVISIATGVAAYETIKKAASKVEELYTNSGASIKINVYQIKNIFFGKNITVTGLITGKDLLEQLKEKSLGEALLISKSMLKTTYPQDDSPDNVFLDDVTVEGLSESLGVKIIPVSNDGYEFVNTILEVGQCQDQ